MERPIPGRELLLVGTVHGDPRGCRRAGNFLRACEPDAILVELSPFGLAMRRAHHRGLQRLVSARLRHITNHSRKQWLRAMSHPAVAAIRRQLALPFEYRAARCYVRSRGRTLHLVDDSRFSRKMITRWPRLLACDNLRTLLSLPAGGSRPSLAASYRQARLVLEHGTTDSHPHWPAALLPAAGDAARERYLAKQVRSALQGEPAGTTVYLGGWEHLVDRTHPPSLRHLLAVDGSRCLLLDRFDDLHRPQPGTGA